MCVLVVVVAHFTLPLVGAVASLHHAQPQHVSILKDKATESYGPSGVEASTRLIRREPAHDEGVELGSKEILLAKNAVTLPTCTPLVNHGTHFGINITVGTPVAGTEAETFDVVVDTGSDSIIVPSCICVKSGRCDPDAHCFVGANHSSTFHMQNATSDGHIKAVMIMFGSGPIKAVPVSDRVVVGDLSADVDNGVLLMVDHQLQINTRFEGILGLGAPVDNSSQPSTRGGQTGKVSFGQPQDPNMNSSLHETDLAHVRQPDPSQDDSGQGTAPRQNEAAHPENEFKHLKGGFLQAVGVHTFSVCFNDGNAPGVLRLGTQATQTANTMTSMGKVHWGLGLMGISVGNQTIAGNATVASGTVSGGLPQIGNIILCDPNAPSPPSPQQQQQQQQSNHQSIIPGVEDMPSAGTEGAQSQLPTRIVRVGAARPGMRIPSSESTAQEPSFPLSGPSDQIPILGAGPDQIPILGAGLLETPNVGTTATPCGAIPDTGSTAIMAPKAQLLKLFEGICNAWQRCADFSKHLSSLAEQSAKISSEWATVTDMPIDALTPSLSALLLRVEEEQLHGGFVGRSPTDSFESPLPSAAARQESSKGGDQLAEKSTTHAAGGLSREVLSVLGATSFISLLDKCAEWMGTEKGAGKGLDELPQINFLLKGENAEPKSFPLSGFAYINEVMAPEVQKVRTNLHGVLPIAVLNRSGQLKKVCTPAFGGMDMETHENGHLWILGQPLFYQYHVNFDRVARTIALNPQATCGSCTQSSASSSSGSSSSFAEQARVEQWRAPRLIRGSPRQANIVLKHGKVEF
jgi:hypothetical protein